MLREERGAGAGRESRAVREHERREGEQRPVERRNALHRHPFVGSAMPTAAATVQLYIALLLPMHQLMSLCTPIR